MATFEDLQKANETIKTTDIKGKDYAEVNQKIKAFRMVYPMGTIETEMLSNVNGVCVFKAVAKIGETILGTGTAYEKEGSTFINKTSYIENCETSAVGRALAMAGFGINTSIASYEDMQNDILNQDKKATPTQIKKLKEIYSPENLEKYLKANNVTKIENIPMEKASETIEIYNKQKGGK